MIRNPFWTFHCRAIENLDKLKGLETVNGDLIRVLYEMKDVNKDLIKTKELLNKNMEELRADLSNLQYSLSTTRTERDHFQDQLKETQALLSQTREEEVSHMYDMCLSCVYITGTKHLMYRVG